MGAEGRRDEGRGPRVEEQKHPHITRDFLTCYSCSYYSSIIDVNLNCGQSGKYIYPAILYTENKDDAIAGLTFIKNDETVPSGYTKVSQNLKEGASGDRIYLCTTKSGKSKMTTVDILLTPYERKCLKVYGYFRYKQDLNPIKHNHIYLLYKTDTELPF